MKQIKGQISLFDLMDVEEDEEDEPSFTIAEFDKRFVVGSRFMNGYDVVDITDIRKGELMAQIKNCSLEAKGMYIGARYYINKESFGKYYYEFNLHNQMVKDGWTNSYDRKPESPGIYEVCCTRDYAFLKRRKMKYDGNGCWFVGNSGIEPNYWRKVKI